MTTMKKTALGNEKGFALLAAIIASLILLAVALLIINMSVGDLAATSMTVGNKKSLAASESGVHYVIPNFNPDPTTWTAANNYSPLVDVDNHQFGTDNYNLYIWQSIPNGTDTNTQYAICTPVKLPRTTSTPGNALGGGGTGTGFGYIIYNISVIGKNTTYGSKSQIDVGIGYGPIPF